MINVFKNCKFGMLLLLVFFTSGRLQAQKYNFESKAAKKLYNKLEKAYENYDYGYIVEIEQDLLSNFEQKQDTLTALVYSFLGESYYTGIGEIDKGITYYKKELALREKIQQPEDYERTQILSNIATASDEMGLFQESEALYMEVLAGEEKKFGKKSEEYLYSVLSLGSHYVFSSEADKGIALLKENEKNFKKDFEGYPRFLITFGQLYRDQGSSKRAIRYLENSLDAFEDLGLVPSFEYAAALNEIHNVQSDLGKFPEAEETLKSALQMLDKMEGDLSDVTSVFQHNLGELYRRLGNYEAAYTALNSSLSFLKEAYGEDSPLVAEDLGSLAKVYLDEKRYESATEYITEAIRIMKAIEADDNPLYYNLISTLASIHEKNSEIDKSIEVRIEAAEGMLSTVGKQSYEYASELHDLGTTYQIQGDLAKAEENLLKAKKIHRENVGRFHPYYSKATKQLAILKWKQSQLKESLSYFDETFENYFKQIDAYFPALSEEEKARFYNQRLKVSFEQFNSFAVANLAENPGLTSTIYNYQLSTKGLIMYATARVREGILNSEDEELIEMYEQWVSQKEQLSKLFSGNDQDLETRNAKIDQLIASSNELEKELSKRSADFAQTFAKSEYTWKDVQKKLKENEAAIEIIRFRNFIPEDGGKFDKQVNYAALIVKKSTKDHPELVLLTNGAKMETRFLANYRNAIRYKVNENYSYKLFWKPIAEKLGDTEKVYFSPDGVYNQISIYTLRNPETKKFLLDELDLQLVTNTKDLVAFDIDGNAGFNTQKAYLFGFPNYNMGIVDENNNDPEKIQQVAQSIAEQASKGRGRGVSRGGRSTGGSAVGSRGLSRGLRGNLQQYSGNTLLALLPGTETEVNNIVTLYSNNALRTEVYQKNQALEEAVKNVEKPQTLHIATHGFFLQNQEAADDGVVDKYVENPLLRSGLIFAGANSFLSAGSIDTEGTFEEDGILTAYEAMNMDLSETKLVVLSACETGLGEVTNGEGVYGLQRAFQIAGAESIIMSMWTVDDNATQELMNTFYEEWIQSGDKQQAFNVAQKRIKDKWKSPYYWGAFVMVGL
mgnify:CR=1 FL=1